MTLAFTAYCPGSRNLCNRFQKRTCSFGAYTSRSPLVTLSSRNEIDYE